MQPARCNGLLGSIIPVVRILGSKNSREVSIRFDLDDVVAGVLDIELRLLHGRGLMQGNRRFEKLGTEGFQLFSQRLPFNPGENSTEVALALGSGRKHLIRPVLQRESPFTYVHRITPRGQKTVRLHWGTNNAAAVIERGQVYLPREQMLGPDGKTDLIKQLVKECANFPNGKYDDMVDTLSQAIGWLLPRTWIWESQQAKLKNTTRIETPIDALREHMKAAIAKKRGAHKKNETGYQSSLFPGL